MVTADAAGTVPPSHFKENTGSNGGQEVRRRGQGFHIGAPDPLAAQKIPDVTLNPPYF
jgi:hypothetical protein